uniref:Bet protein n=1 Tax=Simian foamy virus TaxID=11642 RepID=A0A2U9AG62_9RETR|nr:bet protein [Simian foamy virus]
MTFLICKNVFGIVICAGDDGIYSLNCASAAYCCTSTTCAMIIWESDLKGTQDNRPWVQALTRFHPLDGRTPSIRHLTNLLALTPPIYGIKGACALTEYRGIIERMTGNPLTPHVIRDKSTKFAAQLHLGEQLLFPEGKIADTYFKALAEYGNPQGSMEERVLWECEHKEPYYDPSFPVDEMDEVFAAQNEEQWLRPMMSAVTWMTPVSLQKWANIALPKGWKITTTEGVIVTSNRHFYPYDHDRSSPISQSSPNWEMFQRDDSDSESDERDESNLKKE